MEWNAKSILLPAVNNINALNGKGLGAQVGSRIQNKTWTVNHFMVLRKCEWGVSEISYPETGRRGFFFFFSSFSIFFKCTANSDDLRALIEILKHKRAGMWERFVWKGCPSCRHNAIADLELLAGNAVYGWRVISYPEFSSPEGTMKGSSFSRRLILKRA